MTITTWHCSQCNHNILDGVVDAQDLIWDGRRVTRRCTECGANVVLMERGACQCERWGPLNAHYCDAPASRVRAAQPDPQGGVGIEFLCEQHVGEGASFFQGWNGYVWGGVFVILFIFCGVALALIASWCKLDIKAMDEHPGLELAAVAALATCLMSVFVFLLHRQRLASKTTDAKMDVRE